MSDTSGVGTGGTSPTEPSGTSGPEAIGADGSSESLLDTPISSLSQLKSVLISHLGPQEGTKMYNNFLKSIAITMLIPLQASAQQAQDAAQSMGQTNQT